MRIAVADDNARETELLCSLINEYSESNRLNMTIDSFSDGDELVDNFAPEKYDIVFLDIFMKNLDGVSAAEELRQKDSRLFIVFLTESGGFMSRAFSVHAFDYITKPADRSRIFKVLDDFCALTPSKTSFLELVFNRKKIKLSFCDIIYASSSGHYTEILSKGEILYKPSVPFSSVFDRLSQDERFLLINRGILVNMDFISSFDKNTCILNNSSAFPVRVRERASVERKWQDYTFKKIHERLRG